MKRKTFALLITLLCCAVAGTVLVSHASSSGALTVSAAMSLRPAFQEIGKGFEKKYPGTMVVFNFSSSGKLRQQIEGGAPVDVYASASQAHMDALEDQGLIIRESRRDFAGNAIVLARSSGATLITGFSSLTSPEVKHIAIGNPETSPAGRYAREVLVSLGLWEQVAPRLVYVETVRQVLDYLVRGEVDAGMFYASDAMMRQDAIEVVARAPEASHEPILYPITVVKGGDELELAKQFSEYVLSPEGTAILSRMGFTVPSDD